MTWQIASLHWEITITKVKIKTRKSEVGSMEGIRCIGLRVGVCNRKSRGWSGGTNRTKNGVRVGWQRRVRMEWGEIR